MPRKSTRKALTRQRILEAASRSLRAAGIEGSGVAEIMAAAGLTHGGFYAHFASKAALAATALGEALAADRASWVANLEGLPPEAALRHIVARYLSRTHRNTADAGCAMAAVASEMTRQDEEMRHAFEAAFAETIAALERHMPDVGGRSPRERALATVALSLGGILLARMVASPELSDDILSACRRVALEPVKPR